MILTGSKIELTSQFMPVLLHLAVGRSFVAHFSRYQNHDQNTSCILTRIVAACFNSRQNNTVVINARVADVSSTIQSDLFYFLRFLIVTLA